MGLRLCPKQRGPAVTGGASCVEVVLAQASPEQIPEDDQNDDDHDDHPDNTANRRLIHDCCYHCFLLEIGNQDTYFLLWSDILGLSSEICKPAGRSGLFYAQEGIFF